MIKASEIVDEASFEKWLKEQPDGISSAVAIRVSLRVLPIALSINQRITTTSPSEIELEVTLRAFQVSFLTWMKQKYRIPNQIINTYNNLDIIINAAKRADSAADVARNYPPAAAALAAAGLAGYSHIFYQDKIHVVETVGATTRSVSFYTSGSNILPSIRADVEWLESHPEDINTLIDQPLWLQSSIDPEVHFHLQEFINDEFEAFRQTDLAQDTSFGLIADWYAALLPEKGKPQSLFGEKKDIELATQPEEFWEGEAQEVMDRVAELVGWPFVPPIKAASVVPIWSDGVLINDDRNLSIEAREELAAAALSSMRDEMFSLASDIESEGNIDTRPAKYLKQTANMFPETVPNTKELFALIRREATLIDYFDVVKEQWPDFLVSRYGAMVQEFTLELDAFDERQEFQRQRNKNSLKSYDSIELKQDMALVVATMKTEIAATRIDGSIPEIIEGIDGNKPDELNESPNRDDVVTLDSIESISNVFKQLAARDGDDPVANEVKDMLNKNFAGGASVGLAKGAWKAGEEAGEKFGKTLTRVELGLSVSKGPRAWLSKKYPKLFRWLK